MQAIKNERRQYPRAGGILTQIEDLTYAQLRKSQNVPAQTDSSPTEGPSE